MNVPTRYTAYEMSCLIAAAEPVSHGGRPERNDIVEINSRIRGHNDCLSDCHEQRHDANMQAWRDRHAAHMAAGEIDIAAEIMTQKIIPNRA